MTDRNTLFHQAWGQAKASPEYDKKVWIELERAMLGPKSAKDVPVMVRGGMLAYLPIFLAQSVVTIEGQGEAALADLAAFCKKYLAGETGVLTDMVMGAYVDMIVAASACSTKPPRQESKTDDQT